MARGPHFGHVCDIGKQKQERNVFKHKVESIITNYLKNSKKHNIKMSCWIDFISRTLIIHTIKKKFFLDILVVFSSFVVDDDVRGLAFQFRIFSFCAATRTNRGSTRWGRNPTIGNKINS